MKNRHQIMKIALTLLGALVLLLLWGTAVAQNNSGDRDITRFGLQFGSDVPIAEQQVVKPI